MELMKFNWKKGLTVALSAMLATALVTGCGGGDSKGADKAKDGGKKVLRVGISNFADNLDHTHHSIGWTHTRFCFGETLVKFDKQMNCVPWVAESWSVGDDKLTWTFKINDKAKYSNGKKVTAEAVRQSIQNTLDKSVEARSWANIDSMKAEGQTLTIKTTKPLPGLPGVLADPFFIVVDMSEKRDLIKQGPVCTGPYMVKSFSKEHTIMEKNPNYWNGEVPYDIVDIPSIDDPNTRAMALQSGEIDAAVNIAAGDVALFQDKSKYNFSSVSSIRDVVARLNVNEGRILNDKRVRDALISSLDRPTYCDVLLKKTFIPGSAVMPPTLDYGHDQIKDPNAYNPERAKKLLAEAGWKDSDGDGFVDKNGKNLELDFVYYTSRAELPAFAEATQQDAQKVGIKINLKPVDYNLMDKLGTKGEYDLIMVNIMTLQAGSPINFLNMYWHTNVDGSNPQNASGYSNPKYDELAEKYTMEFDPAKRRQIVIDMQKILMEDTATIVFGHPQTNIVSRKNLDNAEIQACDYYWITKDWKPAK